MKLACVIQIHKSIFIMKNGLNSINILNSGFSQKFSNTERAMEGNFLKRILAYLYCIKYNEINIFLSDIQKHVLCTLSRKIFLIYYRLCLETTVYVFVLVFYRLFQLQKFY